MSVRRRLTAGFAIVLAIGLFGPLQRAVSIESSTLIELRGPLPGVGPERPIYGVYVSAQRGAAAAWLSTSGTTRVSYRLVVAEGSNGSAGATSHRYEATATEDRQALLTRYTCPEDYAYSCSYREWKGADTISIDAMLETVTFSGTLTDRDGGTCTLDASWTARDDPRLTIETSPVVGRVRRPAFVDVSGTCSGEHHPRDENSAEIYGVLVP